jgi:hypothetical protein
MARAADRNACRQTVLTTAAIFFYLRYLLILDFV